MYPSITEVVPCDDYILRIAFDNGEWGTLDIKQFLDFGVFQRLKNLEAFRRVRVAFDTIEWESGVDLDPEFVYSKFRSERTAQQGAPADPKSARKF